LVVAVTKDAKAPEELRVAAVESLGRIKPPQVREFLDGLIGSVKGQGNSTPVADAAVRTLPQLHDAANRLSELVVARGDYPLGIRREALRSYAGLNGGAQRVLALAKDGKLPDDLKTEASTIVNTHPDRRVRDEGARVLPLPKTASGRPIPSF